MKATRCVEERKILYATWTGRWDDSSKAHLSECADCRETAETAGLLCKLAADDRESSFPDAEKVWWDAQIADRERIVEKALRPLAVANFSAAIILVLLVTAALLRGLQVFSSDWLPKNAQGILPAGMALSALLISSIILACIKIFAPIFTED
jgi:hypothetical protein